MAGARASWPRWEGATMAASCHRRDLVDELEQLTKRSRPCEVCHVVPLMHIIGLADCGVPLDRSELIVFIRQRPRQGTVHDRCRADRHHLIAATHHRGVGGEPR